MKTKMMNKFSVACGFALLAAFVTAPPACAEEPPTLAISPLATTGPVPADIEPPSQESIRQSIERGVEFLLEDQRPSGGWGSAEQTKGLNIFAPIPGAHHAFRTAVCGLVIEALVEAEPRLSGDLKSRVTKAIDRGETWLLENAEEVRRANMTAIYNTWGHSYGTTGMVSLYRRAEGDDSRQRNLREAIEVQVEKLERYSFVNGGWGYYDFEHHTQTPGGSPNSFTTATALLALHQAKSIGVEFPQKEIVRAIASIERQRKPDFTYAYGEYLMMRPMYPINRAGGSLGRSQACNLALRLYGDERVSDEVLKTWLNRLYARNGWLSIGRKRPVPHESHFAVAGYFYYYGHYYAGHTIELLPKEDRPYFQDHLANILLPLQEKDGSWWDYPFYNYHQQYGTAMAVTCLLKCEHAAE
ncbi:MAG: hypothetical protein ACR2NU_03635 [Aeoliella sp.]